MKDDDSEEEESEQECAERPKHEETFASISNNFVKQWNAGKVIKYKEHVEDLAQHCDEHSMTDARDIIIEDQHWKYQFEIKL